MEVYQYPWLVICKLCLITGPKGTVMWKPDGRRKAGRPKSRWLNTIENDLKYLVYEEMEEESILMEALVNPLAPEFSFKF